MTSQKTFKGKVLTSQANEFTNDNTGELIRLWELTVMLTEDKGMRFNVSAATDEDLYSTVRSIVSGETVQIVAHPEVRNNGGIKWKIDQIDLVAE